MVDEHIMIHIYIYISDMISGGIDRVCLLAIRTVFVWPMRWHRAWACKSFCGFQSLSKIIQVSAAVRLIPVFVTSSFIQ